MSKKECFNEFAKIIINPDQKFLKALKGGIPIKDVNVLSEALAKIFEFHGKTFSLIELLIISEFNETGNLYINQLFYTPFIIYY